MKKTSLLVICLMFISYTAYAADESMTDTSPAMDQPHPDNTKINKRDKNGNTLTPLDQSNNKSDLRITENIRKSIMHKQISMDAKNIKIITRNGNVTLRGPVMNKAEINKIVELTKSVPGIKTLNNQLEVK